MAQRDLEFLQDELAINGLEEILKKYKEEDVPVDLQPYWGAALELLQTLEGEQLEMLETHGGFEDDQEEETDSEDGDEGRLGG